MSTFERNPKMPFGWFVGLGVLLITLGVVFGLVGIYVVARNKQKYRIPKEEVLPTTNVTPHAVIRQTDGTVRFLHGKF